MTTPIRPTSPAAPIPAKPAVSAKSAAPPPAEPRPVAAKGLSAAADAAIATGLGTGNLRPLDALLDQAAAHAKPAVTLSPAARVLGAVQEGRVTRFFKGVADFFTPSPAHQAQVKRALDTVRNTVWERPLNWLARQLGADDMSGSVKVLADPPDVNAPNAAADAQAKKALADPALKAQTTKAIAKLPADDRRRYERLALQLKDRPRALAGLQALAREGKLATKDLSGGQSLLTHLAAIGTQVLDPSVQKAGQTELLAQVVLEVAEPGAIAQKGMNTCAATVVQNMVARQHPAEYARLVAGLASPAGAAQMSDGQVLHREPDWDADVDVSKRFGGVRSISSRLLQPAFMQYGCSMHYDNTRDGSIVPMLDMAVMGMVPWGMTKLLKSLTGRSYDWDVATRISTFEQRMRGASLANPVPIALNYAETRGEFGPHWVQVIGFDQAANRIIALNPWGRQESIPLDVATSHLLAVVHPQ